MPGKSRAVRENRAEGILDAKCGTNPLTGEVYSEEYCQLRTRWSTLPAWGKVGEILQSLEENPVTVVTSPTGSGKTVVVPMVALHHTEYEGKVAVSMPKRRIIPRAAEYATATLGAPPGVVGYQFRGSGKTSSESNRLVYQTDGLLVSRLVSDGMLRDYRVVVIDEAHERKVQIDLLMLYLRNILLSGERPDFRIVIMSATIDTNQYREYYQGVSVGVVEVGGGTVYPVEVQFQTAEDRRTPVEVALGVLGEYPEENALLFTTSGGVAKTLCRRVREESSGTLCVEVYSEMPPDLLPLAVVEDEYRKEGYDRKLVISTNLAESSITISDITTVIDSGWELVSYWNSDCYGTELRKGKITRAGALQRKGRVGRTGPGRVIHCYTEEDYLSRPLYPPPDISRDDPTLPLLQTSLLSEEKSLEGGMALLGRLMDPPPGESLRAAIRLCVMAGLAEEDYTLTPLAETVASMASIPLQRSLFLIYSSQRGVLRDAASIVGLLESCGGRLVGLVDGREPERGLRSLRQMGRGQKGDHWALHRVAEEYRAVEVKERDQWAEKKGLRPGALREARRKAASFYRRMSQTVPVTRREEGQTNRQALSLALGESHRHLTAVGWKPVQSRESYAVRLAEGCTLTEKQASGTVVYDSMSKTGRSWEYGIVTVLS